MYLCGIDVAKRKHMAAILLAEGQVTQASFSVTNTREDFDQLH